MWIFNEDDNKWVIKKDQLTKSNYDYLKQELKSTRYYSKCLSGATYLPINNTDNIYDILGEYEPKNWYIDNSGSQYSYTDIPFEYAKPINGISSNEYYTKYLSEYGLTLKNLFTPEKLINDSINYIYVDVATTAQIINFNSKNVNLIIDGVKILEGHRILVKDQISTETLPFDTDPNTYFKGNYKLVQDYGATIEYQYYNSDNGIYTFNNGYLIKTNELSSYEDCIRYSVSIKLGTINTQKQFHLSRLLNGYYPTTLSNDTIEFTEKHNWVLRNRVDYNNLFEINYYDVLKHSSQTLNTNGVTYSILERTISVGEFGVILNTQGGISNIINNKYKVNLRSITQTDLYYWITGDAGLLLKVNKIDFSIERKELNSIKNLKSVSFYNNLRGVVVGELNTIFITDDGGINWNNIIIDDFDTYYYNKVIFTSLNKIYIVGNTGVFIELEEDINGWSAYKRRISKFIDYEDELLLVDNINDVIHTKIPWGLSYSYPVGNTQSTELNKEVLLLTCVDSKVIVHDINNTTNFDFIYLDFNNNYGDINGITQKGTSSTFYFSDDSKINKFDLLDFKYIGEDNIYSNSILISTPSQVTNVYNGYVNKMFDYNNEFLICGNTSLLMSTTYSNPFNFKSLDESFESRLKSKMLFVDYDVASKLNFFTDSGEYRLPNSITINLINGTQGINLNNLYFTPLSYGATAPSFMTQSETNWLSYWKDTQKTFEYYSATAIDESSKVEISTNFSYSSVYTGLTISSITNDINDIYKLAPNLKGINTKGFSNETFGITSSTLFVGATLALTNIKDLDYIVGQPLIIKNSNDNYFYANITTYDPSIGNLSVLVTSLSPNFDTNLDFSEWITDNVSYSRFDGFGLKPITAPNVSKDLYIYDYLMIIKVNNQFPVDKGDIINLTSSVVNNQFLVNKIFTSGGSKYIYMYNDFNESIINDLISTSNTISITNLNKFNDYDNLSEKFNLHPISNGYKLIYESDFKRINISAKFNNITSYYNLATNVISEGLNYYSSPLTITSTMSYTDGFLKFGYTPTYNLLDYLEGLNDTSSPTLFSVNKEYLAMPIYKGIPGLYNNSNNSSSVYFSYNGINYSNGQKEFSNKIVFGSELELEWQSIFINTFVDIIMYENTGASHSTERLLVMKKYYEVNEDYPNGNGYVIEFHKGINYPLNSQSNAFIDIISRRTLLQISNDLQELNNIQRSKFKNKNLQLGSSFNNYEKDINTKISTDSYTKILLSDVDTIKELSSIIYTDYKNELAMNITKLSKEYTIKIQDTNSYNGNLLIICSENHDLKNNYGVVLEFDGGENSSQVLNQQYFGYHSVTVVDKNKFYVNIAYNPVSVNDTGYVKYIKNDPFFNYQPVDIIDVGVNKMGKVAIELNIDNLVLKNDVYSLVNVDYNKYRFKLVDGLNIESLLLNYSWILEAEISEAIIGIDKNNLIWYKGIWECGRWFGGTWISGTWKSGDWYSGIWNSNKIKNNLISVEVDSNFSDTEQSIWYGGRWYDGTWNNGTWVDGRWYGGTWNKGNWYKGIWNDGTWNNGEFSGGIWVDGTWNNGILNCDNEASYWIYGKWNGGDFENGIWYNGIFEEKNSNSRFGTKSYNSRNATWRSGKWLSGSFYSRLDTDDNGNTVRSDTHKYSIWRTGVWYSGDWYGGVSYNIDFQSGTWYGGILEDIQIIGININTSDSYVTLNGEFEFNIGDLIYIVSNDKATYTQFGTIEQPKSYKVIFSEIINNKKTKLYIDIPNSTTINTTTYYETGLRVVSKFKNTNWKSGIWTNGLYESGLWEGGLWYDGVFGGNWM